ncbi:scarecrow-like protein 3 [Coffea eugenioides]|uniref:scarecrow-like protein 3 n=1 Tax=Coffea eugenioides TaxID=49369 RepID=UPI000F5D167A|nr:scarecrow-like protein 3 [Coffea arabica]XP_027103018.1 scarecrow-like protein 3 [Coffea arabica]XP_027122018.1 scarecrow-like protein 3 [Coffea arabica]XP_027158097.1 scarecrow-like protein 3 [Coffea eugenioides]
MLLVAGIAQEEGSSPLFFFLMSLSPSIGSPYTLLREMKSDERGMWLFGFLTACARCVAAGSLDSASSGLEQISLLASPDGDIVQRIVAYFTEALADRVLKGWRPGLHKALNSTKLTCAAEIILAQKLFFEYCPFLRLSYVITNQAILETMEGEKVVHIIDLHCFEPAQWINLLEELKARQEGPPHLRITGIHEQKEVLDQMAVRLQEAAEKLDIPFQFCPMVSKLENLDIESLRVKSGEAVAISSVLQLHSLLAYDDDTMRRNSPSVPNNSSSVHLPGVLHMNPRTLGDFLERDVMSLYGASPDSQSSPPPKTLSFLNALWGLSPKLMVVTEHESNHNCHGLMERVDEALKFYAALFDCLENTLPRAPVERQKIEKFLFGEEIKSIIACEGLERKARHEKLDKWIPRLEFAGFGKINLSYNGMKQAMRVLQSCNYDGFKIKEESGYFIICWHDYPLFSVSAWGFKRY